MSENTIFGVAFAVLLGCRGDPQPDAAAEPMKAEAAAPKRVRGEQIAGQAYWQAEKLGRVRELQVEDGIAYVQVVRESTAQPFWLSVEELEDDYERYLGYRDAIGFWIDELRGGNDSERAEAMKTLKEWTGVDHGVPAAWSSWWAAEGEFVEWDEPSRRFVINRGRHEKRVPRARWGLRLLVALDRADYAVGEPIRLDVSIENVSNDVAGTWVKQTLVFGTDLDVDVRHHSGAESEPLAIVDIAAAPALTRDDFIELGPGARVRRSYVLTDLLVAPRLEPGAYSIRVTYQNEEDGSGWGIATPVGRLEGLTSSFRVRPAG